MNPILQSRIADMLLSKKVRAEEKKMFGGVAFMVRGNMTVGVTNKGEFMVRIAAYQHEAAVKKPGARTMEFTGRPMKGFLFISEKGYTKDSDLEMWIDIAMKYNASLPEKKAKEKKSAVKKKAPARKK